jgi:hypothetical protein
MASNILSSAAFTSANMKPASGEQLDAVWGQNIADNSGYLRYRKQLACSLGGIGININGPSTVGTYQGTTYFPKFAEYNHLVGSYAGTTSSTGNLVGRVDGTLIFNHVGAGSLYATSINMDISHLTNGNWYPISAWVNHDGAGIAELRGLTLWMDI